MFTISPRSSSFVRQIDVNPFNGEVNVVYKNNTRYEYDGVSRRAILNLMFNKNMSLGFWVNENLLPYYKNVSCFAAWLTKSVTTRYYLVGLIHPLLILFYDYNNGARFD